MSNADAILVEIKAPYAIITLVRTCTGPLGTASNELTGTHMSRTNRRRRTRSTLSSVSLCEARMQAWATGPASADFPATPRKDKRLTQTFEVRSTEGCLLHEYTC